VYARSKKARIVCKRIIGVDQIIDHFTDRTNGMGSRGRKTTADVAAA
jgi:hypothetical protein